MSRPPKIDGFVLTALREILEEDENTIIVYTDEELVYILNASIHGKEHISYRTFQRYKAKALEYGDGEDLPDDIDPIYIELYHLIRRALLKMKMNLMKRMMAADKDWYKYKWIMERKFKDWNLHSINTTAAAEAKQPREKSQEEIDNEREKELDIMIDSAELYDIRERREQRAKQREQKQQDPFLAAYDILRERHARGEWPGEDTPDNIQRRE